MSDSRYVALVDRLRRQSSEREWLEFRGGRCEPGQLGQYLSALANSACLAEQPRSYLVFGIEDGTHEVVGTDFRPHTAKGKGNQDLLPWLGAGLDPNPGFRVRAVNHPKGRVVVFEVAPARGEPVTFRGTAYVRIGSSKTELSKYPDKARAIWTKEIDWSAQPCDGAGTSALEPTALLKARERFLERHPGQRHEVESWDDLTFLHKTRLFRDGMATNAALLLLGRPEYASLLADGIDWFFWMLKDADNRPLGSANIEPPLLDVGDRVLQRIRNLTVRFMPKGTLTPKQFDQYDSWVVREVVHNAIAHQDYFRQCRVSVVEFPDCVIVNNAGAFVPGDVETVLRRNAPEIRYRNPLLARVMYELGVIDTQGGGIRKMFETQRERFFPLPDYNLDKDGYVEVTIHGRLFGEAYSRLLMERPDLTLEQVMLLDKVQKGRPVSIVAHMELEAEGLVRGAHPHPVVADPNLDVTAPSAMLTPKRLSNHQYYVDLVVSVVVKKGPVGRKEIDEVLMRELPADLTDEQKRIKIQNLIQEARKSGRIVNRGSRSRPVWVSGPSPEDGGLK